MTTIQTIEATLARVEAELERARLAVVEAKAESDKLNRWAGL